MRQRKKNNKSFKKLIATNNSFLFEGFQNMKNNHSVVIPIKKKGRIKHAKKNHSEYNIKMNELNIRKTHDCTQHEDICVEKFEDVATSGSSNLDRRAKDKLIIEIFKRNVHRCSNFYQFLEILTHDKISFLQQGISVSDNIQTVQNVQAKINGNAM